MHMKENEFIYIYMHKCTYILVSVFTCLPATTTPAANQPFISIWSRSVFAADIIHKMKCFIAKQFQINQANIDVSHISCT